MNWPVVWLAVIILAAIVEGVTTQLVSIWFVLGGIGALIASLFGVPPGAQILIFGLLSAVALICTRPVVKKILNGKKVSTNADRYIGKVGVVTVAINNTLGEGQVNVLGSIWTARSADGVAVEKGRRVLVESIDGVKLMVRPINEDTV